MMVGFIKYGFNIGYLKLKEFTIKVASITTLFSTGKIRLLLRINHIPAFSKQARGMLLNSIQRVLHCSPAPVFFLLHIDTVL
jgi:hypothetical protein